MDTALSAIAGAQVAVLQNQLTATTDPNGFARFENLAPGTYTVAAASLGYTSAAKSVAVAANEATKVQLGLAPIEVAKPYVEVIGPNAWYFDCRLGNDLWTGTCGTVCPLVTCVGPPSSVYSNDHSSKNFTMTKDVVDFVGEMRWQPGSFATTKALRLSFSYEGRTSSHWFCTATSASPVQWHYHLAGDGSGECKSPVYCGIDAQQLPGSEPKVPDTTWKDKPLVLQTYTNTPFGCAEGGDPTHAAELALQQHMESMITLFHGLEKPDSYTAFPDG